MKQFIILIFALAIVVACKKEDKTAIDEIATVPNTEVVDEVI